MDSGEEIESAESLESSDEGTREKEKKEKGDKPINTKAVEQALDEMIEADPETVLDDEPGKNTHESRENVIAIEKGRLRMLAKILQKDE